MRGKRGRAWLTVELFHAELLQSMGLYWLPLLWQSFHDSFGVKKQNTCLLVLWKKAEQTNLVSSPGKNGETINASTLATIHP